jgi:hypothetical protein
MGMGKLLYRAKVLSMGEQELGRLTPRLDKGERDAVT